MVNKTYPSYQGPGLNTPTEQREIKVTVTFYQRIISVLKTHEVLTHINILTHTKPRSSPPHNLIILLSKGLYDNKVIKR